MHGDRLIRLAVNGLSGMSDLPLEKALEHRKFCDRVAEIKDVNVLRVMLANLHESYLRDQAMVVKIARNDFWSR